MITSYHGHLVYRSTYKMSMPDTTPTADHLQSGSHDVPLSLRLSANYLTEYCE